MQQTDSLADGQAALTTTCSCCTSHSRLPSLRLCPGRRRGCGGARCPAWSRAAGRGPGTRPRCAGRSSSLSAVRAFAMIKSLDLVHIRKLDCCAVKRPCAHPTEPRQLSLPAGLTRSQGGRWRSRCRCCHSAFSSPFGLTGLIATAHPRQNACSHGRLLPPLAGCGPSAACICCCSSVPARLRGPVLRCVLRCALVCTHATFTKGRSIFSRSTENGPAFP